MRILMLNNNILLKEEDKKVFLQDILYSRVLIWKENPPHDQAVAGISERVKPQFRKQV